MTGRARGVPLHGREVERAAAEARLRALRDGRSQNILVRGEAGIGKSRLIDEVVDGVRGDFDSLNVLRAKVEEVARGRPFGAIVEALRSGGAAEHLADVTGASGTPEYETIERVAAVFERLALDAPTILVVDDLQWADSSTLRALTFAARHVADVPFGMITAFRPVPSDPQIMGWLDDRCRAGALDLQLRPLDHDAIGKVLADLVGGTPGERLLSLAAGAAGNPFYLIELADALAAESVLVSAADTVDVLENTLPVGFGSAIIRFVSVAIPGAIDLLRVAAVLGVSFSVADLATVSGATTPHVVAVLEEARRAGILREVSDGLGFKHDLLREALYQDISESARRALHRDLATALAKADAPPVMVAEHLLAGGPGQDRETVHWLLAAAHAQVDKEAKADLLVRVLDVLGPRDSLRREVAVEAADALAGCGRLPAAQELLERELALDPGAELALRVALVRAYGDRLDHAAVLAEIDRIRRLPELSSALIVELESRRAAALVIGGQPDLAVERARWVLDQPVEPDSTLPHVFANHVLFLTQACAGKARDAVQYAENAVAAETTDMPSASHVFLYQALLAEDRFDEADRAWRIGYARARATSFLPPLPHYLSFRAVRMLLAGRLDDAAADAEACLSMSADLDILQGQLYARAVLSHVALHRADLASAVRWVDLGGPPPPEFGADWYLHATALAEHGAGRSASALDLLVTWWEQLAPLRYFGGSYTVFAPDLVRIALEIGDRDRAGEVSDEVARLAPDSDAPSAKGSALLCQGLVSSSPSVVAEAVTAYEQSGRPLQHARAREDLAALSGPEEAVSQLRAALATYELHTATADAARTTTALRALGLRIGARGRRSRPAHGWESLTPTEEQVVELAISGLVTRAIAERLFISPHTAETHLRHVYRKLGIRSRHELTAAAATRGTPQP